MNDIHMLHIEYRTNGGLNVMYRDATKELQRQTSTEGPWLIHRGLLKGKLSHGQDYTSGSREGINECLQVHEVR